MYVYYNSCVLSYTFNEDQQMRWAARPTSRGLEQEMDLPPSSQLQRRKGMDVGMKEMERLDEIPEVAFKAFVCLIVPHHKGKGKQLSHLMLCVKVR